MIHEIIKKYLETTFPNVRWDVLNDTFHAYGKIGVEGTLNGISYYRFFIKEHAHWLQPEALPFVYEVDPIAILPIPEACLTPAAKKQLDALCKETIYFLEEEPLTVVLQHINRLAREEEYSIRAPSYSWDDEISKAKLTAFSNVKSFVCKLLEERNAR